MSLYTTAFHENLSVIFDELQMARQWGQASIILTIHKSTFSQDKTKRGLRTKIARLGYRVVEIEANKVQGNFVDIMLQQENVRDIVFYLSNIDWGNGRDEKDSYRILNLYRETFIEHKIKAIFFLTMNEASNLPDFAPDFWAFRHRVLEFAPPHAPISKKLPVGLMIWQEENWIDPKSITKENITSLKKILTELPDRTESISLRIDLQYELGQLYWSEGDSLNAEKKLEFGLDLIKTYNLPNPLKKYLTSLAIIYYEQEKYTKALELLESLTLENPNDCSLLMNQAIILFAINKRFRAISKGKKATSLCPQNPWAWNILGFLYYFAGKISEAIGCFQKAIEISPKAGYFYESIALCYLTLGLPEKASFQLKKGLAHSGNREIIQNILRVFCEDIEKGNHTLKNALDSGRLNKLSLSRDPILSALVNQLSLEMGELTRGVH